MKNSAFFAKNKFALIGEILIMVLFLIINKEKPLFGIDYQVILIVIFLFGVWKITEFFEKIVINSEGIAFTSLFSKILIPWENIENFSAFRHISKREIERLYPEDLENSHSNKNIFKKIVSLFGSGVTLFISVESGFFPTKRTPMSKRYLYFSYTPEILEEIQKWLLMLNKNV